MFRLDRLERFSLTKTFSLIPKEACSFLFGSRTDLKARGGDIDILLQIDLPEAKRFELSQQLTLAFQEHCEEKIDFVVFPKTNLDASQVAFLQTLKLIPLERVIQAPLLDHVAILVRDLNHARSAVLPWGFPVQNPSFFEGEGTTEVYAGEPYRGSRVLLMAATAPGPYQEALERRGPGLHHLGIRVPSMEHFLASIQGTGWYLHPISVSAIQKGGAVYLARPGAPLLIEVEEAEIQKPALLAPVVERVRVQVSSQSAEKLSCLDIPELYWSLNEATALLIGSKWISVDEL